MAWTSAYSLTYTGQSNASAPAAGGSIGIGPGVGQPGNAAGAMIDVAGGIWSVSGAKLVSLNNGNFSDTANVKAPARVPLGQIGPSHGRVYGREGDYQSAIIHLRTAGGLNTNDGVRIQVTGNSVVINASAYGGFGNSTATGATLTAPVTLDWEIRSPTTSEATTLGTSAGQEVLAWKVYNGDNMTEANAWTATGIVALPIAMPSQGYIQIGDRIASVTSILVETQTPVTLSALRVNQGVSTAGLVMEVDVTAGVGGSDTVAATLYYLDGQSSTPVSIKTANRTGPGTIQFSSYIPVNGEPHFYRSTVIVNGSLTATTTNYVSAYQGGPIASVPMPASYPFTAVPTPAAIPSWAKPSCGPAIGIAGDSRGTGIVTANFRTVANNNTLAIINGSVGGTGASSWNPASVATNCPIAGQSGKNMFTGLRDAVVAAGGKWIIFCHGTNDLVASDDATLQADWRAAVNGFVAAGLKVYIEPDDARVYPTNGMAYQLNHNYFMRSLADGVNVFAGDFTKLKYWWNNIASLSTDGVHWVSYTNRWAFTSSGWGDAVRRFALASFVLPDASQVVTGVSFGPPSSPIAGTVLLPDDSDVRLDVTYGPSSTITGSLNNFGGGSVAIDHNFGGVDAMRIMLNGVTPVSGATITAFEGAITTLEVPYGQTTTDSNGRWTTPLNLEPGESAESPAIYTLLVEKRGVIITKSLTLEVPGAD